MLTAIKTAQAAKFICIALQSKFNTMFLQEANTWTIIFKCIETQRKPLIIQIAFGKIRFLFSKSVLFTKNSLTKGTIMVKTHDFVFSVENTAGISFFFFTAGISNGLWSAIIPQTFKLPIHKHKSLKIII